VELVTHTGKKVKFYDDVLKDKIVVLNLMYANCEGVCPPSPPTCAGNRNPALKYQPRYLIYSIPSGRSRTRRHTQEYAKMPGIKDKYWTS